MNEVEISVVCAVYNHEKYLRETLEGFVSQKTRFSFEVIINDDVSTDNSAAIIREYEQKYPNIIKPIYQTENQYSQGRKIFLEILFPRVKGKYVAICEGDDCWIDPYKLQKQYDLLEERQDVDICAHNAEVRYNSHYCGQTHITNSEMEVIPFEEVVNSARGFIPTMSVMIRKKVFERPESGFLQIRCFDEAIFVAGALKGGMLALSDVMSVYHIYTAESWNVRNSKSGNLLRINVLKKYAQALEKLNQDTNNEQNDVLSQKINRLNYDVLFYEKKYFEILRNPQFKKIGRNAKVRIWLCCFHLNWLGSLFSRIRKIKSRLFDRNYRVTHSSYNSDFLPFPIPSYYFGYGTYPPRSVHITNNIQK